MLHNLDYVKLLGLRSKEALERGDLVRFGELLHEQWEHKKRRSAAVSNRQIDEWYSQALKNGAIGGKLVGAGGGGFLMFYAVRPQPVAADDGGRGSGGGALSLRL